MAIHHYLVALKLPHRTMQQRFTTEEEARAFIKQNKGVLLRTWFYETSTIYEASEKSLLDW